MFLFSLFLFFSGPPPGPVTHRAGGGGGGWMRNSPFRSNTGYRPGFFSSGEFFVR